MSFSGASPSIARPSENVNSNPACRSLESASRSCGFKEFLHGLGVRHRTPELEQERAAVAGFVAARDGDDLLRSRHRADRAEEAECVAGLEHADLQRPDPLYALGSRLLPQPNQGFLEHPLCGERSRGRLLQRSFSRAGVGTRILSYRLTIGSVALRLRWVGASATIRRRPRPDAGVPGVGHGEHHGLLVDRDAGRRISGTKEQLAAAIDVLALLDAAPHPANEDVVANQHGERGGRGGTRRGAPRW